MGEGRFTAGKEKGQEKMKMASRVLLCGFMVVVLLGLDQVRGDGKVVSAAVVGLGVGSLDEGEVVALIYTREEEKLARDTYLTLYGVWEMPVFSNIAASEQSHMDAVLRMLEKYGLEDPAAGMGV